MISVEPAIDPKNKISFLLDWELTLRCNLDCSYCGPEWHNNETQHPQLVECLRTIDFMFEYVDLYMKYKAPWSRNVVLNVYGGESIFHPDIITIHKAIKARHEKYKDRWTLLVQTTTNLVAGPTLIAKLASIIDYWTCSYHTEANDKQKQQFKDNLLYLQSIQAKTKVIVLMNPFRFDDAARMIDFCVQNKIEYLPRQLDDMGNNFPYTPQQVEWFNNLYNTKSYKSTVELDNQQEIMTSSGRACCGGRQICTDSNFKNRNFFIQNEFKGWNCSVNWFFLYVKQYTGEIFVNKDCQMSFDGTVGPIGNLKKPNKLLENLKNQFETNSLPVITCAKNKCFCGLCAPKAESRQQFDTVFEKYLDINPLLKS